MQYPSSLRLFLQPISAHQALLWISDLSSRHL